MIDSVEDYQFYPFFLSTFCEKSDLDWLMKLLDSVTQLLLSDIIHCSIIYDATLLVRLKLLEEQC